MAQAKLGSRGYHATIVVALFETLFSIIRLKKGPDAIPYSWPLCLITLTMWLFAGLGMTAMTEELDGRDFLLGTFIGVVGTFFGCQLQGDNAKVVGHKTEIAQSKPAPGPAAAWEPVEPGKPPIVTESLETPLDAHPGLPPGGDRGDEPGAVARDVATLYFGSVKGLVAIPAGAPFPEPSPSPTVIASIETSAGKLRSARPVPREP